MSDPAPGRYHGDETTTVVVPTADPLIEAAFLACVMVRPKQHLGMVGTVDVSDFSELRHQLVWSAIQSLTQTGTHIDVANILTLLAERGEVERVGGMEGLIEIQGSAPSLRHAADYAERLKELSARRRAEAAAIELRQAIATGRPLTEVVDEFLSTMAAERSRVVRLEDGLDEFMDMLDESPTSTRVRSGISDLDQKINGGLRGGQLLLIGARPSMGKSAFALGWAYEAAKAGHRTLVVTAEMAVSELAMRLVARASRISLSTLAAPGASHSWSTLDWKRVGVAVTELSQLPLDFVDASPTVGEIRAQVMGEAAAGRPYKLVVVDYLQLLTPPGGHSNESRQLDVSAISRSLKLLARELDVPIIALSQLSRNVDHRSDRRPVLGDLRTSGSLEQDADIVLFLFRPEVYEPGSEPGVIELMIAKQRNGSTGTVRAVFLGEQAAVLPTARNDSSGSGAPIRDEDEF